jgi:hypothetical protein
VGRSTGSPTLNEAARETNKMQDSCTCTCRFWKSGHGRVVLLFEEREKIWRGSPTSSQLDTGLESVNISSETVWTVLAFKTVHNTSDVNDHNVDET